MPTIIHDSLVNYIGTNDLYAHCENPRCRHSTKLDLRMLIKRYGNLKGTELRKKLYCSVCGSREISTSLVYVGGMGARDKLQ